MTVLLCPPPLYRTRYTLLYCYLHILPPPLSLSLQAAEDARRQMGNRRFYDQMLMDACHHHQLKVTDEVDVTTMKEYMQVRFTACMCRYTVGAPSSACAQSEQQ